jgi:hypothetical protein
MTVVFRSVPKTASIRSGAALIELEVYPYGLRLRLRELTDSVLSSRLIEELVRRRYEQLRGVEPANNLRHDAPAKGGGGESSKSEYSRGRRNHVRAVVAEAK